MTCPYCGHSIGPHDLYCMTCGHGLTPANTTQRLDTGGSQHPVVVEDADENDALPLPTATAVSGHSWASGSSLPASNPYRPLPPVPRLYPLPGPYAPAGAPQPLRRYAAGGRAALRGMGVAIVGALVVLGKIAGAVGGFGLFKVFGLLWLFQHGGPVALVFIAIIVVAALAHNQLG